MPIVRDDKSGKFRASYTKADIEEIKQMISEGRSKPVMTMAIMQAKEVTEATAWRWIKIAKGEEVNSYAKKTNEE